MTIVSSNIILNLNIFWIFSYYAIKYILLQFLMIALNIYTYWICLYEYIWVYIYIVFHNLFCQGVIVGHLYCFQVFNNVNCVALTVSTLKIFACIPPVISLRWSSRSRIFESMGLPIFNIFDTYFLLVP